MLQAANTGLFMSLVPNAHNSECQNLLIPLQIKLVKSVKASLQISIFTTLGTNELSFALCMGLIGIGSWLSAEREL